MKMKMKMKMKMVMNDSVEDKNLTARAKFHYNAAEGSSMRSNGKFPNVIKAYYSAYVPDPQYRPKPVLVPASRPGTGAGSGTGIGSPIGTGISSGGEMNERNCNYINNNNNISNISASKSDNSDNNNNNDNDNNINKKRPYSHIDNIANNSFSEIQEKKINSKFIENFDDRIEKKIEIWESKKFLNKYYIMDNHTNSAIWVDILPRRRPAFSSNERLINETIISSSSVFDCNSSVDLFCFKDPRNNEICRILKANFVPQ